MEGTEGGGGIGTGRRLAAVAVVAAVVGVAFGGAVSFLAYRQLNSSGTTPPVVIPGKGGGGGSQTSSLASVVAKVAPSVVEVVRLKPGGGAPTAADSSDGFVASSQGLVVTSEAAVAGASGVEVVLVDGQLLPATIAAADPVTGLVLLQVSSPNLPPPLAFGAAPALGSTAIAVTLSLGGTSSVDVGTANQLGVTAQVSDPAVPRGSATLDGMMLTDVPEPEGSSGAPLVDAAGQVVGILNGRRMAPVGPSAGYLALDATEAGYLVGSLSSNGAAPRPLGLVTQYLSPATAAALQLSAGARVLSVQPGSAAAAAGLRSGDVVVSAGGSPVLGSGPPTYPCLADLILASGPGTRIPLVAERGGTRRTLSLTVPLG